HNASFRRFTREVAITSTLLFSPWRSRVPRNYWSQFTTILNHGMNFSDRYAQLAANVAPE
ncbi:MAG: hypothetical protein ACRD4Q_11455, partial [Candidatus Acidiferrales bacterium]